MKLSLLLSYQDPSTQHSVIFIFVWMRCGMFFSVIYDMCLWVQVNTHFCEWTHMLIAVWVCVRFSEFNSSVLWVRRVNVVNIALVSPEAPEEIGAIFTPTHLSHTYPLTLILQAHLLHIAIYSDHWGPNSDDL